MKWIRHTVGMVFPALAAACTLGESEGRARSVSESVVRDSAGVRIVETAQTQPAEWRVGTSPLYTVGWGSDGPTFTWVQSGQVMPDGGALVADYQAGTIYRIGPEGSVVATWGRKGEGPGEYQRLDAMILRGDSIFVSDSRLMRVTLLSLAGDVRAARQLVGGGQYQISSVLSDGRLLLVPGEGYSAVSETRPEWVFERQPIVAAALESGTVDTLAMLPHLRRWYGTPGATPGPVMVRGRAGGMADGFAWSRADAPEVRWYDGSGRLVQIARWDEEPVPLTPDRRRQMAAILEDFYRSRDAEETVVAAELAELEEDLDRHAGPLPYWDSFHVDRQGNAWLHEYSLPGAERSVRWRVIARDGTFVGWIEVPDVVSVLDITDDLILGVRSNELDVPAVVMFDLLKR